MNNNLKQIEINKIVETENRKKEENKKHLNNNEIKNLINEIENNMIELKKIETIDFYSALINK